MTAKKVTFGDKSDSVAIKNRKIQAVADDFNQIKSAVNDHANKIDNLEENQRSGVIVKDTKAEVEALPPVEGVSYKVTNDGSNNGFWHYNGSVLVYDGPLATGIVEKDNIDPISGDTAYKNENIKLIPFRSKSIDSLHVTYDYVAAFSGLNIGDIESNVLYDCINAIELKDSDGTFINVSGAVIHSYLYYSAFPVSSSNYLGQNTDGLIMEGTKYAVINFLKTDNASGYQDLLIKLKKSNVLLSTVNNIENSISRKPIVNIGYVAIFGGTLDGKIAANDTYDCTKAIKILGRVSSRIIVENAVPLNYIFYNSDNPSSETFVDKNSTGFIPDLATHVIINFDVASNTDGYGELEVKFDSSIANLKDYDTVKAIGRNRYNVLSGWVYAFSGGSVGELQQNASYACIESIKLNNDARTFIQVKGANVHRYMYYSGFPLGIDTYLSQNTDGFIPDDAVYVAIDFEEASNPNGYDELDLSFIKSAALKRELNLLDAAVFNDYTPLLGYVVNFGGTDNGKLTDNASYDCTPPIKVVGKSNSVVVVKGAVGSRYVFYNSDRPSVDSYVSHNSSGLIPDGVTHVVINFVKAENTDGYDNLIVTMEESVLKRKEHDAIRFESLRRLSDDDILKGFVYTFGGEEVGKFVDNTGYDCTHMIRINADAGSYVKIKGATLLNCIFYNSEIPSNATYVGGSSAGLIPEGATHVGINFSKSENTEPYECEVLFDKSVAYLEDISGLANDEKAQAKTLCPVNTNLFNGIKPNQKDVYVVAGGDSIMAFASTDVSDDEGVTRMPPVCDRAANANKFWRAVRWGNPQYRRFDHGKFSLVGNYSDEWIDDTEAFYVETGAFNTEYIGAAARAIYGNTSPEKVTTLTDYGSFANLFDDSESAGYWQRGIPKRFSSAASASVQFTIPAGYSKFDFLYHAHIDGDNVAIEINRGNGVVLVNDIQNDWGNGVEANAASKDLSLTPKLQGAGDDNYGVPNSRLHFQILDTSIDTVVTLTKSSNTSKFLIYWGVSYWGTSELPYALHLDIMNIGGYGMGNMWNLRGSMFAANTPDVVLMEICYNTLANADYNAVYTSLSTYFPQLKSYIDAFTDELGIWIPHKGGIALQTLSEVLNMNYKLAEKIVNDEGALLLGNASKLFYDLVSTYYRDETLSDWLINNSDGVHLFQKGHNVYSAFWESL